MQVEANGIKGGFLPSYEEMQALGGLHEIPLGRSGHNKKTFKIAPRNGDAGSALVRNAGNGYGINMSKVFNIGSYHVCW
jgi:hypothetical protein